MGNCFGSGIANYPEEEYWRLRAMQLATASVMPMVMQAVVDLGVLDIISLSATSLEENGGVSSDEIASQLELTGDTTPEKASSMLDRMLCLLASHSILTCTISTTTNNNKSKGTRLYNLSPIAKYFIPNSNGISLGPFMSLHTDKVLTASWAELKSSVLEGSIPFNRAHGMNMFEYMGNDRRFNDVFNKAMINNTTIIMGSILDSYRGFEQLHQVVDVGGGLGVTLKLITSKYPHIKGINFDLQHVVQHAPYYHGVEHVAGDMFENVPSGDAIFMKSIIHNWSEEHCLKLLKNCYKALPRNGKVIVVEQLLPEVPDSTPTSQEVFRLDLTMMMSYTSGGREQTEQEFLSMATTAGFAGIRYECVVCNYCAMELYK